jgi:type II secretory pathway component GspD/PulD (secretin)
MRIRKYAAGIMCLCFWFLFASAEGQEPPTATAPGDHAKITMDIKGMDVVDVMKMVATRAGLNLVIGKNVVGKVTLFLKDVDIMDAFELLILSNDLAYDTQGKIINVMTQRDYELQYGQRFQDRKKAETIQLKSAKAADLSRALNQIKTSIGRVVVDDASNTIVLIDTPVKVAEMMAFVQKADLPVKTQIFNLNYAQADKLGPKIQDALTKGVGSMRLDERTNKIVVTDYPERLVEIDRIISAFDEKPRQVLIDAQIIEVRPSDMLEMGVDWDYWLEKHFKISGDLPIGTGNRLFLGTPDVTPTKTGDYKAILDLLRTIGDVKILSSPRIMAINNQEAKILVGTKDAYITSSTSQQGDTAITAQTVNFVDVGIKLYVTPTISPQGFVTMKIRPEISSAEREDLISGGETTQVPIVTTSESETTVVVKDGVSIIIAGLQKDSREKTVRKIPLVGDLPLVGFFFRSTSDDVNKTELVILLTPHIMSGETPFTDFNQARPNQGALVRMVNGQLITEHINDSPAQAVNAGPYYKLIMDRARTAAFAQRPADQKGLVKLAFVLSKDGNLVGEPRIIQGDNAALSTFALQAVKNAAPFPAFPGYLNKNEETFKINLSYE